MGKGGANTINLEGLGRKTPSSARHFFSLPPLAVLSMSTFAHCVARAQAHVRGALSRFCCNLSLEGSSPPFLLSSTSRIKALSPSLPLGVREYKGGEGTGCATGLALRFVGTRFLNRFYLFSLINLHNTDFSSLFCRFQTKTVCGRGVQQQRPQAPALARSLSGCVRNGKDEHGGARIAASPTPESRESELTFWRRESIPLSLKDSSLLTDLDFGHSARLRGGKGNSYVVRAIADGKLSRVLPRVRDARLFSSLLFPPKPKVAHSIKINASECTPKPKTDDGRRAGPVAAEMAAAPISAMPFPFCVFKALKVPKWEKRKGWRLRLAFRLTSSPTEQETDWVITSLPVPSPPPRQLRSTRGNAITTRAPN